mgnify:CR=1 FL=1
MQWEALTSPELGAAARETGVCLLSLGVLERHSEHLPLGTDYLTAHGLACRAAELEPAVVFPPFYFGQIYEARCFPGAVALKPALLLELLGSVLDEIGRNGFRKIILVNGHGGNTHLLSFLNQSSLWAEKPYAVYMPTVNLYEADWRAWEAMRATDYGGHADEMETSMMLALHGELVHMDRVPEEPATGLPRMGHLPPTHTGIWWYARYPEHYAGDARTATAEKGEFLVGRMVAFLADYIRAVKADEAVPGLLAEFFARERALRSE